jgi:hypothetical protein
MERKLSSFLTVKSNFADTSRILVILALIRWGWGDEVTSEKRDFIFPSLG